MITRTAAIIGAALITVTLTFQPAMAADEDGKKGHGIKGAWKTQIEIPGRPLGPIPGIAIFHKDGTVVWSDSTQVIPQNAGPGGPQFYTTPGIGAWKKAPTQGFSFKYVELLILPSTALLATCTANASVEMKDDNSFSGNINFECVTPDGQAQPPSLAPVTGKRIVAP